MLKIREKKLFHLSAISPCLSTKSPFAGRGSVLTYFLDSRCFFALFLNSGDRYFERTCPLSTSLRSVQIVQTSIVTMLSAKVCQKMKLQTLRGFCMTSLSSEQEKCCADSLLWSYHCVSRKCEHN